MEGKDLVPKKATDVEAQPNAEINPDTPIDNKNVVELYDQLHLDLQQNGTIDSFESYRDTLKELDILITKEEYLTTIAGVFQLQLRMEGNLGNALNILEAAQITDIRQACDEQDAKVFANDFLRAITASGTAMSNLLNHHQPFLVEQAFKIRAVFGDLVSDADFVNALASRAVSDVRDLAELDAKADKQAIAGEAPDEYAEIIDAIQRIEGADTRTHEHLFRIMARSSLAELADKIKQGGFEQQFAIGLAEAKSRYELFQPPEQPAQPQITKE